MAEDAHKIKYVGPPDQMNDVLGGKLEPGETYDAGSQEAFDELILNPLEWYEPATGGKKAAEAAREKAAADAAKSTEEAEQAALSETNVEKTDEEE